ncbi:MAG TPA: aspartyl protease family protein [Candidatus Angelobacter sp.]
MLRKLALSATLALSAAGLFPAVPQADTTSKYLQTLLEQRRYVDLEQNIRGHLAPDDAVLFQGIVANRKNRVDESIRLLAPLAPRLASAPPSWREKELLITLADDYSKAFAYAKSADTYSVLLSRYSKMLSRNERRSATDRRAEMQLLREAPPQTVELNAASTIQAARDPLGLIEIPVEANGKNESWMLDTGANTSVVTESTARRIGLRLLEGSAQTGDVNGTPVNFRVGVLPELKIGSTIFHDVELPVASDQAFNIAGYQIEGIVGFPVQSALRRITVYADGRVGINEAVREQGSELFMDGQTPIAVVKAAGEECLFSLDTGATGSSFSSRFYPVVKSQLTEKMRARNDSAGAGGVRHFHVYKMEGLSLTLGGQEARLASATIFPKPIGSGMDVFFGNLGQDVFGAFQSYTIDFENMTFIARK